MSTVKKEDDENIKPENKTIEPQMKIVLEYFKVLTWPVIVLFLIFKFASPISNILSEVPDILGKADSIEIGKFKISISKVLAKKASPEVRKVLKQFDDDDIEEILEAGNSKVSKGGDTTFFPNADSTDVSVKRYLNWTQLGLVSRLSGKDLKEYAQRNNVALPNYGFVSTQLLADTRNFLISFIPNVLDQQK